MLDFRKPHLKIKFKRLPKGILGIGFEPQVPVRSLCLLGLKSAVMHPLNRALESKWGCMRNEWGHLQTPRSHLSKSPAFTVWVRLPVWPTLQQESWKENGSFWGPYWSYTLKGKLTKSKTILPGREHVKGVFQHMACWDHVKNRPSRGEPPYIKYIS